MTSERIIELLTCEQTCVKRQGTDKCDRNCARCDLIQDSKEIEQMYDEAEEIIKNYERIRKIIRGGSSVSVKCLLISDIFNGEVEE